MPRNPGFPSIIDVHRNQTHCINGHKFTEENTYIAKRKKGSYRMCRKCKAIREKERRCHITKLV